MGDGRIFLKTGPDASFNNIYQMSLILTGSISLDSTFNSRNNTAKDFLACQLCLKSSILLLSETGWDDGLKLKVHKTENSFGSDFEIVLFHW